jgi:uncharacterized protein (DUF2235 family)
MKRIVICADGTWNEPERKDETTGRPQPTNVLKVARAILPRSSLGIDQIVYYHEGVGTEGGLDKFTGGAFGSGMAQNVRALYRFLVYNFELGDQLCFFGFSRGAFTVRTLAGFMYKVGLLEKDDEYYTPEIYDLYQSSTPSDSVEWKHAFRNINGTRPRPPISFIGVWDTVGALGAPGLFGQILNRNKYKYHDIGLNPMIQNAYHALAIDERRKPFAPSLWTRPAGWDGTLEQVWFAGVHSNVGGSYHPDGLANEALHWVIEKAENIGLEFDKSFLQYYRPCFNSVLNDSMTVIYKVMGPHVRPIGQQLADGEAIHQSVIDRKNFTACNYDPQNLQEYLGKVNPRILNTVRIGRGKPCE